MLFKSIGPIRKVHRLIRPPHAHWRKVVNFNNIVGKEQEKNIGMGTKA